MPRDDDETGLTPVHRDAPPDWKPTEAAVPVWLQGVQPEDLDAVELEGRYYYRTALQRRDDKGALQEVLVRVTVPTNFDKARARVDSLEWVQKLARLKARPTWEEAQKLFGEEYVDQLDTLCLVARITRDEDDPNHQYMWYEDLDRYHTRRSLEALQAQVHALDALSDPRQLELTEEQFWATVGAIDRVRNCSPLVAIDGRAQDSFVTTMASRLWASRTSESGSPSTPTS